MAAVFDDAHARFCGPRCVSRKERRMAANNPAEPIRGHTMRFTWTEGPTKDSTQEHVFHEDGTVEWRSVRENQSRGSSDDAAGSRGPGERPRYSSTEVTDDFWLVSYLSNSGYTLTVVLNFEDGSLVGVASNDENWFPLRGRFQVVS